MIPPGIEPGTLSVLDSRDNHYTTEPTAGMPNQQHSTNEYNALLFTCHFVRQEVIADEEILL